MRRVWLLMLLVAASGWVSAASGQGTATRIDSMLVRVRTLVDAGNFAAAKGLADSALVVVTEGTARYGDVLYWRSLATRIPNEARRDLVRVAIEYPNSARFPNALVKLAEMERAAGDRASARRRLERVVRDHLGSNVGARAALALGEQLLEEGGVAEACVVLDSARAHAGEAQVELANRIAYAGRQCVQRLAAMAHTPPATVANAPRGAAADSNVRHTPPTAGRTGTAVRARTTPAAAKGPWSVQVAAHTVRGDALRLEARMKAGGYDVRIVGTAPYRVRIGKFVTRAEAVAVAATLKAAGTAAIVVEAERR